MNRLSNFFSRESASRAEVCGSLFLGGRVAYVTSMGSQAGDAGGVRIARHMAIGRSNRFVMIAQPMTRWQLGRLVERLNILGTYRLAALRDLPRLNEVSRKVRRIGNVLDRYRRREKLLALDPDKAARDLKRWSWALSKLRVHFAALSGPAAGGVATPGDGMTGGIAYRIERSRYYVARFHSTLSDLRIRRVEGFQPYDEFVRRRYAGTWDRIDRLGERYQRLQQRLNESGNELELLEQSRQTISIMQSTKAQERQTASIANSTQAQLRQTKAQVELLRAAERFAIFPVSYYGGMLFSDFFHVLHLNPGDHGIIPGLIIATMYAIYQSLNINLELKREAQGAQPQKLPVDASHERSRNRELWLWVVVAAALASSAYLLHLRLPAEKTVKSPPPLHVTPSPQKPLPTQIKNKAELARPLVNRPEQKHLK